MDTKNASLILFPTLGFGIGGLLAGYAGDSMFLGFVLMGLLGGAAFGYSLGFRNASLLKIALFGAVGFFFGMNIPLFVVLTLWEPPMKFLLMGLFGGGIGGMLLGLSIKTERAALKIGLGGAIGFGIGMLLFEFVKMPFVFAVAGILGGAAIGLTSQTLQIDR